MNISSISTYLSQSYLDKRAFEFFLQFRKDNNLKLEDFILLEKKDNIQLLKKILYNCFNNQTEEAKELIKEIYFLQEYQDDLKKIFVTNKYGLELINQNNNNNSIEEIKTYLKHIIKSNYSSRVENVLMCFLSENKEHIPLLKQILTEDLENTKIRYDQLYSKLGGIININNLLFLKENNYALDYQDINTIINKNNLKKYNQTIPLILSLKENTPHQEWNKYLHNILEIYNNSLSQTAPIEIKDIASLIFEFKNNYLTDDVFMDYLKTNKNIITSALHYDKSTHKKAKILNSQNFESDTLKNKIISRAKKVKDFSHASKSSIEVFFKEFSTSLNKEEQAKIFLRARNKIFISGQHEASLFEKLFSNNYSSAFSGIFEENPIYKLIQENETIRNITIKKILDNKIKYTSHTNYSQKNTPELLKIIGFCYAQKENIINFTVKYPKYLPKIIELLDSNSRILMYDNNNIYDKAATETFINELKLSTSIKSKENVKKIKI